jgi:hypothetical protein
MADTGAAGAVGGDFRSTAGPACIDAGVGVTTGGAIGGGGGFPVIAGSPVTAGVTGALMDCGGGRFPVVAGSPVTAGVAGVLIVRGDAGNGTGSGKWRELAGAGEIVAVGGGAGAKLVTGFAALATPLVGMGGAAGIDTAAVTWFSARLCAGAAWGDVGGSAAAGARSMMPSGAS